MKLTFTRVVQLALAASTTNALCMPGQLWTWDKTPFNSFKSPSYPRTCNVWHEWTHTDSLAGVANRYHITPWHVEAWNCFIDGTTRTLHAGIDICVGIQDDDEASSTDAPRAEDVQVQAREISSDSESIGFWAPITKSDTTGGVPAIATAEPANTLLPEKITDFMTDSCDAGSEAAEDCRVTLECDVAMGEYPTCDNGKCRCLAIPCKSEYECDHFKHCRQDDEVPTCRPEPFLYPDVTGICACKPRREGCMLKRDPHGNCDFNIQCFEKMFSGYPERAMCDTRDGTGRYSQGRCSCHPVDCDISDDKDPWDACKDFMSCGKKNEAPFCAARYRDDGHKNGDGYCACRDEENPVRDEDGTSTSSAFATAPTTTTAMKTEVQTQSQSTIMIWPTRRAVTK